MSNSVKYYLAAYNLTAFIFWLAYAYVFIMSQGALTPAALLLLNVAQGMAILEIVHALLKWVKSPVLSTTAQVFSRVLVVALLNMFINTGTTAPVTGIGAVVVTVAWVVTELTRYSFYLLSLFNLQPRWLLWMRYTLFIVLYPLGVLGEWLILITPLYGKPFSFSLYTVFIAVTFVAYVYYFPVLYGYMWKQRRARIK